MLHLYKFVLNWNAEAAKAFTKVPLTIISISRRQLVLPLPIGVSKACPTGSVKNINFSHYTSLAASFHTYDYTI
jgi:hypothetical protein